MVRGRDRHPVLGAALGEDAGLDGVVAVALVVDEAEDAGLRHRRERHHAQRGPRARRPHPPQRLGAEQRERRLQHEEVVAEGPAAAQDQGRDPDHHRGRQEELGPLERLAGTAQGKPEAGHPRQPQERRLGDGGAERAQRRGPVEARLQVVEAVEGDVPEEELLGDPRADDRRAQHGDGDERAGDRQRATRRRAPPRLAAQDDQDQRGQRQKPRVGDRLLQEDDGQPQRDPRERRAAEPALAQVRAPLPERDHAERVHPRVGPHLHRVAQEDEAPAEKQRRPCSLPAQQQRRDAQEDRERGQQQQEVEPADRAGEGARRALQRAGRGREQPVQRRAPLLEKVAEGKVAPRDQPSPVQVLHLVVIAPGDQRVDGEEREHRREGGPGHAIPDQRAGVHSAPGVNSPRSKRPFPVVDSRAGAARPRRASRNSRAVASTPRP